MKGRTIKMNEYRKYASGQPVYETYSEEEAKRIAPYFLRQLESTEEIIKKTPDPETFFHRFGYALFLMTELAKMEDMIPFEGALPSERKHKLLENRQEYLKNLITRICDRVDSRMTKLKTQKSVIANIERLKADLKIYETEMSEDTIFYLERLVYELKQKHESRFEVPEHI